MQVEAPRAQDRAISTPDLVVLALTRLGSLALSVFFNLREDRRLEARLHCAMPPSDPTALVGAAVGSGVELPTPTPNRATATPQDRESSRFVRRLSNELMCRKGFVLTQSLSRAQGRERNVDSAKDTRREVCMGSSGRPGWHRVEFWTVSSRVILDSVIWASSVG